MDQDELATGFTLSHALREATLLPGLLDAMQYHRRACPGYARILDATDHGPGRHYDRLSQLPWLPARVFKGHTLSSAHDSAQVTVLNSSGTSGSGVSRIALDRASAERQRRCLAGTLQWLLGPRRLPLLIVDSPAAVTRERTSIRGATVLGVMNIGRDPTFALDDDGRADFARIDAFLTRHRGSPIVVFGFTFLVWSQLYELARHRVIDLRDAIVLHTGGWKKLADQAVSPQAFRAGLHEATGVRRVHNFYGMVEQGGTIHVESPSGDGLYSPDHAEVIIRDPHTWEEAAVGVQGVIQVSSLAPRAHPGHLLLTEDWGVVHGIDDGQWPGKRFSVLGRIARAEPRGCSDTMATGDGRPPARSTAP